LKRYFWISLGGLSLALGIIGIPLPLLPTTPFLLLAAFAFSQGSPRLHTWLIEHAHLGPPIAAWRAHRAVSRASKRAATAALTLVFGMAWIADVPGWMLVAHALLLVTIGTFLWTRREPPSQAVTGSRPPGTQS
jgi:uncharacterized membrane protein YbaN (DUF454 family)